MSVRILFVLLVALGSCTSQAQDDEADGAGADRRAPPSQPLDSPSGAGADASGDDNASGPGQPAQVDSPSTGAPVARAPNERLITPDGWGPLRIGMSTAEVIAAAGEDASPAAVGGPDPDRCDEFRPSRAPAGILVMLENGVLTRISVSRNTGIETPEGFRIGDSGDDVMRAYGSRAQVEPHQYQEAPAKYITVWWQASRGAERHGIRYEVDATGNIAHIRAGGPAIEYVEGCV